MSILKFLPIFIGGMLLCGCESGTVMTEPEIETLDQEISRVENEDVVSMTDKDNCFLCGSNRPGIFDYYKNESNVSVCLSTRSIANTNASEYDDNGKIVEEPNGFSTNINTHGENECSWMVLGSSTSYCDSYIDVWR